MTTDESAGRLVANPAQEQVDQRMHPVIARFRTGLREKERQELDRLYLEAEENIELALKTVGFVTDLEKILFAMVLQLLKRVYMIEEENRSGKF